MATQNSPGHLSIEAAAAYMGVRPRTIREWIKKGNLPARRVGPKLIRIRISDLDAFGSPIGPGER